MLETITLGSKLVPIAYEGETATISSAVTTAIGNAAQEVTKLVTDNAATIIGVVVGFVVLSVGIRLVKKVRTAQG